MTIKIGQQRTNKTGQKRIIRIGKKRTIKIGQMRIGPSTAGSHFSSVVQIRLVFSDDASFNSRLN